MSNSVNFC